jgi:hypothetical protein
LYCTKYRYTILFNLKNAIAEHWWLMPVILAIQDVKIRKIIVLSQHRQIVPRDPVLKKHIKKDWWCGSRCRS